MYKIIKKSPDKQLLEYLKPFGVGNYQSLDNLLSKIFGSPCKGDEVERNVHYEKIDRFLDDLVCNDFIKLGHHRASAAIQPKGIEYLGKINFKMFVNIIAFISSLIGIIMAFWPHIFERMITP